MYVVIKNHLYTQEIEIALQVEYAGNCEIAVDADLVSLKYLC